MKIRTAKRLYRIEPNFDAEFNAQSWRAVYQALNPKTGKPWQAYRYVSGWDGHWLCRAYGEKVTICPGALPSPFPAGYISGGQIFLTEASALRAIHNFDPETINAPHI